MGIRKFMEKIGLLKAKGVKVDENSQVVKELRAECKLRKKHHGGYGPMSTPRRWAKGYIHRYASMLTPKMEKTRHNRRLAQAVARMERDRMAKAELNAAGLEGGRVFDTQAVPVMALPTEPATATQPV